MNNLRIIVVSFCNDSIVDSTMQNMVYLLCYVYISYMLKA